MLSVFVIFSITILFGCSRGNSVLPDEVTDQNLPTISDSGTTGTGSDRSLLGMWQVDFDVNSMTAKVEPVRSADFHLNILPYIQRPTIYVRSWNPSTETVDVDVSIYNSSVYIGYDVRLIIFNDTIGHKLLNPDNYTHIWDIPGGTWSNGFKAYVKDNPQRCFHSLESASENLHIKCPGGNFSVKFAIDACHPFNCPEPYQITNFHQGTLQAYEGASAEVTIDVFDWQYNTNAVRIQCPAITGETDTYMTKMDLETWGVSLTNNTGAPAGEYFALIAAGSEGTIEQLIHYVSIIVTPENETGWARSWGGIGGDYGYECGVDSSGNIFVVGAFCDNVDFDPDPIEEDIHSTTSRWITHVFLSKFNRNGDYQWVYTFDSENREGLAVDCDSENNIYIGGRINGGDYGSFLTKISQDGDLVWDRCWGTESPYDEVRDISVDSFDNIFVVGQYRFDCDFNPDPVLEDIHENNNSSDCFLCKYSSNGEYIWGQTWGGEIDEYSWMLTTDSSGNAYCGGAYYGTVDFDPGPLQNLKECNGSGDCFLTAFSSKSNYLWTNVWGGGGLDFAHGIDTDAEDNILIAGIFNQTVDFNPDPIETEIISTPALGGFVSKFKPDGDFLWVLAQNGAFHHDVHAGQNGSFYISGHALDYIDFDPGPGVTMAYGEYLAKYDLDRTFDWVSLWSVYAYTQITSDIFSNIYVTGWFEDYRDFDPSPDEYYLSPVGYEDVYLMKVLPNGLWEY
jgi:hypothetical protein